MIALLEEYGSLGVTLDEPNKEEPEQLGVHVMLDYKNCPHNFILSDGEYLSSVLKTAAQIMGMEVIKQGYHNFNPQGATAFCILGESHIAIHTWPEYKRALVDVLSCGNVEPKQYLIAKHYLSQFFGFDVLERSMKR